MHMLPADVAHAQTAHVARAGPQAHGLVAPPADRPHRASGAALGQRRVDASRAPQVGGEADKEDVKSHLLSNKLVSLAELRSADTPTTTTTTNTTATMAAGSSTDDDVSTPAHGDADDDAIELLERGGARRDNDADADVVAPHRWYAAWLLTWRSKP